MVIGGGSTMGSGYGSWRPMVDWSWVLVMMVFEIDS